MKYFDEINDLISKVNKEIIDFGAHENTTHVDFYSDRYGIYPLDRTGVGFDKHSISNVVFESSR